MTDPNRIFDILERLVICEPSSLETGCWIWPGAKAHGYGCVKVGGKNHRVHRVVYEYFRGPVPDGLDLDHLCHDETCKVPAEECPHRSCCNFEHLKPATRRENIKRGLILNRMKTHCPKGHPYEGENLYVAPRGNRVCKTCRLIGNAERCRNYRQNRSPR